MNIKNRMQDQTFRCTNCNQQFPFTSGEQEFYTQKGLAAPTRCMICRSLVKSAAKDQFRGKSEFEKENQKPTGLG